MQVTYSLLLMVLDLVALVDLPLEITLSLDLMEEKDISGGDLIPSIQTLSSLR